jgi:3-hydroxyisobutyrate dehydrogenase
VTRVTVLGLGAMGSPIARRLHEVATVTAYDPIAERRRAVVDALGVRDSGSAAEACREAEAVVLVVADAAQAQAALFGPQGAVEALPGDAVVVVMSTIGPTAMRDLAARLSGSGLAAVDAPMTGGSVLAERGELVVFAAALPAPLERVAPLLAGCSRTVHRVGDEPGSGQTVKLVNQLLCAVHMIAAAEALALAGALGLDQHAALDMVASGAAQSFILERYGPRMIDGPYQPAASALTILLKDAGLVLDEAERLGLDAPVVDAARRVMQQGVEAGLSGDDITGVIRVYADQLEVAR